MGNKAYPDGTYDFKELTSGEFYFVDKTLMIRDLCRFSNLTYLYTRPRRFGKSTNLTMLDYFFNIKYKDEPDIFTGLKIDSYPECKAHKNAYPVIRMNFADLRSGSKKEFYVSLRSMVSNVADEFNYLIDEKLVSSNDARFLNSCSSSKLTEVDTDKSIRKLCSILEKVYGKKTIVLVDEYDYCIQNIRSDEEANSFIGYLRPFMEQTFKFNDNLKSGVVTGIVPVTKASMLSSFNNACMCTILDSMWDEYFGFTEDEVKELLCEAGKLDKMDEIREWYDGYRFGDADVYNPYSVMMYLKNGCEAKSYWNKVTVGGLSADLISSMGSKSLATLKGLYENKGSVLLSPIDGNITYSEVMSPSVNPSVVYSYLAMTGYLKVVRTGKLDDGISVYEVGMVNEEISLAFKALVGRATEIEKRVDDAVEAIYSKNPATAITNLESMLIGLKMDKNWSQDENPTERHNRYRDVIMAYLITPELQAHEEIPKGYGLTDIFFSRTKDRPPIIIEIKTTVDPRKSLKSLAKEALKQIDTKRYADEPGMEDAILVGIAIREKKVEVAFGR